MIGSQFGQHSLYLAIKGYGAIDHIVKDAGHIGTEFKVADFLDLVTKYLVFAHTIELGAK
jgi:hypothetical protein